MNLSFVTTFFRDRVFGHLPSTVAGGIAAVCLALATYIGALTVDPKWQIAAYIGSALLAAIGAAYVPKPVQLPPQNQ